MRDDREQILVVSQDQAVVVRLDALSCLDRSQLTELTSSVFDFCGSFRLLLTSLASKGAITVRGGVLKSTLVVDNDTTVHGVHTDTVASSPSVLIKCSICSYHH